MSYSSLGRPSSQVPSSAFGFCYATVGIFSLDQFNSPLFIYNSNITAGILSKPVLSATDLLSPYHRKQTFSLINNVKKFVSMVGLERTGFLTLTFRDNVICHKEAYRRFGSLRKHLLSKLFLDYMLVKERQKRGAWHYHLLVGCNADIRTGIDFVLCFPENFKLSIKPDYRSASPYLRSLWRELRNNAPKYGFGEAPRLEPIRSTEETVARYIGKYINSNVVGRNASGFEEQDKGVNLISYSRKWIRSNTNFAWNSPGAKEWRRKLQRFATEYVGVKHYEELSLKLGSRWAYFFADVIQDIDFILEAIELGKSEYGGNYVIADGQIVDPETGVVIVESQA